MNVGELDNSMPPKTRADVEKLMRGWLRDPSWDIETTEGYEEYHDELLAFRLEREAAVKAEMLPQTHFADWIGKRDPAWHRLKVEHLIYPLVSEGYKGMAFVRSFDDEQLYVCCIYRGAPDTLSAEIDRIAAGLRESHPELTLGQAEVFDAYNENWYGFTIDRLLTEQELERGDRFRLEIFDGSDGPRGQAAFERRVSDTLRQTALKVKQVALDHKIIVVVLARED